MPGQGLPGPGSSRRETGNGSGMKKNDAQLFDYFLAPGYIFFNVAPSLLSTVLGSSVAVSLWDRKNKYGGMANFLYPAVESPAAATSRYGNVAVRHLIKMFLEEGTDQKDLQAQIFGGSTTSSLEGARVARENILVARKILLSSRIEVLSEDVGGQMGRKIVFNTLRNEAVVYKVNDLRYYDWYPYNYGGDREG